MAYLFDTDALSETMKSRPLSRYVAWLRGVARDEQFTSAMCVGELVRGAHLGPSVERHMEQIEEHVLGRVTVLAFDAETARVFGEMSAAVRRRGRPLADADVMIAATAVRHGLALVTGDVRHMERFPEVRIEPILAESRTKA